MMKEMRRAALPAAVLGLALSAAAPARAAPETVAVPVELLREIDQKGAQAVLLQVYEDDPRWQQVLDGIATGSRAWLRVAERFKRVAREQSEELTVAVGRALETEPAHALAVLGDAFDADDVCSLNTLEQSLGRDYAAALRRVEARERGVARVTDPALRQQRDDCLGFLRELKREVVRNRKTWFSD
jgi:hypothetical protein